MSFAVLALLLAAAQPAPDGTVYAIDKEDVRLIMRSGIPVRSASVRVTYSPAANAEIEQAVRGYYVRCLQRTAGVVSSTNTARGTKRLSMERTKLADIEYRSFDALPAAEKAAMETICALPL